MSPVPSIYQLLPYSQHFLRLNIVNSDGKTKRNGNADECIQVSEEREENENLNFIFSIKEFEIFLLENFHRRN